MNTDLFLPFGSQYYRAPTPPPACWERDLAQFKSTGFNTIKYWAQWRWNHPEQDIFCFDDLDRLMELAAKNELQVIINTLFDCAPTWLYALEDDCRMLTSGGKRIGPMVTACRQIGGAPGPCLNHPEAMQYRMQFLEATVKQYREHPALYIWDTWNEPELSGGVLREARVDTLLCYCPHCIALFKHWLEERYGLIEMLNERWGRNYTSFDAVEVPVQPSTFGDMIDWRLFQTETITREQKRRVDLVRSLDKTHIVMCHTVPMPIFNPITCCTDEWALAEGSDWVGNSLGSDPFAADLIGSAGGNRRAINAEIHAIPGTSLSRPKPLSMEEAKRHIYIPLAHNIKGFVFWQYRPESLGLESPAWGLTRPDGTPTPWHSYFAEINRMLQSEKEFFLQATPEGPEVGILYNPANHIFAWCAQGSFEIHDTALRGVYKTLYESNYRIRFVHPEEVQAGNIDDLSILLYPFPYVLDMTTALQLKEWVRNGGTLIGEVFFGNFQLENSLHSETVPGYGLNEVFGACEGIGIPHAAAINLYIQEQGVDVAMHGPKIVLKRSLGQLATGHVCTGYLMETPLECDGAETLACFEGSQTALSINTFGKGRAMLAGTLLSVAAYRDPNAQLLLENLIHDVDKRPKPTFVQESETPVRIDVLACDERRAIIVENLAEHPVKGMLCIPGIDTDRPLHLALTEDQVAPKAPGKWEINLPAKGVELYFTGQ